jgi:hypothetical protein
MNQISLKCQALLKAIIMNYSSRATSRTEEVKRRRGEKDKTLISPSPLLPFSHSKSLICIVFQKVVT